MNTLIIGNNTKYAELFSYFSSVYVLANTKSNTIKNRLNKELDKFNIIECDYDINDCKSILKRKSVINKVIISNNIDIVFSNRKDDMIAAYLASRHIKRKIIKLVTFHNSYSWLNKRKVSILKYLINKCTDKNIALSHLGYDQIISSKSLKDRTLYLPNTVDYKQYIQKKDYDIDLKDIKCCFVGVVKPGKNQFDIVKNLSFICDSNKAINVTFDIYGDLEDKQYSDDIANYKTPSNLKINLKGRTSNEGLRNILPNYDLYISASLLEMSPYNILEAQASGLPVIAYFTSGHSDLINNKMNGYLYKNQKEFIEIFNLLIISKELRVKIGNNAIDILKNERSVINTSKKLQQFIGIY